MDDHIITPAIWPLMIMNITNESHSIIIAFCPINTLYISIANKALRNKNSLDANHCDILLYTYVYCLRYTQCHVYMHAYNAYYYYNYHMQPSPS